MRSYGRTDPGRCLGRSSCSSPIPRSRPPRPLRYWPRMRCLSPRSISAVSRSPNLLSGSGRVVRRRIGSERSPGWRRSCSPSGRGSTRPGGSTATSSADNLLVERAGRLRMVDAGNAVPVADQIILTGFTPAFTSPRIFAAATQGLTIPGTLASVLPSFGKVLHFALTGHEQFNGHLPNLDDPVLGDYSSHCRLVMEMLAEVDERPEKGRDARIAVAVGERRRGDPERCTSNARRGPRRPERSRPSPSRPTGGASHRPSPTAAVTATARRSVTDRPAPVPHRSVRGRARLTDPTGCIQIDPDR